MRIAVVGTGGVGGYFGGRLAQAGESVAFVARGAHLQALREHGLRVDSVEGDFTIAPAEADDDLARIGAVDAVLIGVKAWQVAKAQTRTPPSKMVPLPARSGPLSESARGLGPPLSLENTISVFSRIPAVSTAATTWPIASSTADIIPASLRR